MKFLLLLLTVIGIPALAHADWTTNHNQALKKARDKDKAVLMYFTGSDFCGFCKKLDREALDRGVFEDYAKKNLVLLKLDFPARKRQHPMERRQNEMLQRQYRVKGYPTLILLDSRGRYISQVEYRGGGARALIRQIDRTIDRRR